MSGNKRVPSDIMAEDSFVSSGRDDDNDISTVAAMTTMDRFDSNASVVIVLPAPPEYEKPARFDAEDHKFRIGAYGEGDSLR